MFDRRGDGGAARRWDEVNRTHPAALRAEDVDVEVVANEEHLVEVDAEKSSQRLEDRLLRFALAMFVRKDHGIDEGCQAELLEDFPQRIAGRASGVADQADPKTAALHLREHLWGAVDHRRQHLHRGSRVRLLQRVERRLIGDFELQRLEKMIDLRPARDVAIGVPVELLTATPPSPVGGLDLQRRGAESTLGEDALHPLQAQPFVLTRLLERVGDQSFPEIEGNRFERHCNFTRPGNPSSYV